MVMFLEFKNNKIRIYLLKEVLKNLSICTLNSQNSFNNFKVEFIFNFLKLYISSIYLILGIVRYIEEVFNKQLLNNLGLSGGLYKNIRAILQKNRIIKVILYKIER